MESDWTLTRLDGRDDVALVTVELHNPSPVDRRVRVTNRLSGPLLPPRRAGVPERGWDADGFTGVVPAGDRLALGYACPAPDERPPVEISDEGRATAEESGATVAAAIRGLAEARPPADALPDGPATSEADGTDTGDRNGGSEERTCEPPSPNGDPPATECEPPSPNGGSPTVAPPAVESWLAAAERRIERGERLTDASAETVASALDGGDVADLGDRIAADAERLRAVAERAEGLAERAGAVDVPHAALRRLA
ncbi:hypothetical protein EI982_13200 [Haloplanus rallus]|jgi:hypothetical protein|uniref:DUF8080 domain-containing protein n=1 Tax=Haloplanus rallus TaxID=1816183 RepID=A0A6B9FBA2_9EURY|nr:hypothetical protein [Haloplanus rallus]QGX95681.1 hypothetical protein EI982_13200 [Haloplanus rallus]